MRPLIALALLFVIAGVAQGAGERGRASADRVALRLVPCISAAADPQSTPTSSCCSAVHAIGQSPSCLCSVMLSGTARAAGLKPEVAITIPKRCNMTDRPVGYKCGDYTLPGRHCQRDRASDYDKLMNAPCKPLCWNKNRNR